MAIKVESEEVNTKFKEPNLFSEKKMLKTEPKIIIGDLFGGNRCSFLALKVHSRRLYSHG